MLKRNHVSVLAVLASFSLLMFSACSDDAGSNPTPVATESSAVESSSSVASSSETGSGPVSSSSEAISKPESSSNEASSSSVQEIERPSLEKMNEKCREQHDAVSIAAFDGVKTEYFCLGEAYGPNIEETFSILDHAEISLYSYAENGWQEVKCNAENEGRKEIYGFRNMRLPGALYYKCADSQWVKIGADEYNSGSVPSNSSGMPAYRVDELPECKADNENAVDSVNVGPSEWTYYECKQGTWNESLSQRALRILPTCGTEREGAIDSMQVQLSDSASYYRNNYYFKCEQGTWIDLNHAAPLAAAVQAQCEENRNSVSLASYDDVQTDYWCGDLVLGAGGDPRFNRLKTANIAVFTYTDAGWTEEKCDAANEGKIEKYHYAPYHSSKDLYFKCSSGKWNNLGEQKPE